MQSAIDGFGHGENVSGGRMQGPTPESAGTAAAVAPILRNGARATEQSLRNGTERAASDRGRDPLLDELLAFQAPYVVDKLLSLKTAATRAEAEELFEEAKKYLWLIATDRERDYPILSLRVDEAWHQFLLYTRECYDFCVRIFGCFMNHAPPAKALEASEAGANVARERGEPREVVTREVFAERYLATFGRELPRVWRDDLTLALHHRVVANEGPWLVRTRGDRAELVGYGPEGERVRLRVDAWAEPALRFVLDKGIFYVREVPGLDDDERIALCRILLVENVLLVVA